MSLFTSHTPRTGAFEFPAVAEGPLVATAIHAGHQVRGELRRHLLIDEADRLREEDPFTDVIAAGVGPPVLVHRSRFEVDLNRPRDRAIYRLPEDSWGLDVWREVLPPDVVARSLELYDAFYRELGDYLDRVAARGAFVVFDVHSYNYRRDRAHPTYVDVSDNPDVNVGTGSMDRRLWAPVVDSLIDALRRTLVCDRPLDVRENVRFRGANLAAWVHERYPGIGCAIALEFKKTFMDEHSGVVDEQRLYAVRDALASSAPTVQDALDRMVA